MHDPDDPTVGHPQGYGVIPRDVLTFFRQHMKEIPSPPAVWCGGWWDRCDVLSGEPRVRRLDRLSHARVVQDERRTWALGERHSGALFSWRAWVALPHDLGVSPGRTT